MHRVSLGSRPDQVAANGGNQGEMAAFGQEGLQIRSVRWQSVPHLRNSVDWPRYSGTRMEE